jgi:hypothetical protein
MQKKTAEHEKANHSLVAISKRRGCVRKEVRPPWVRPLYPRCVTFPNHQRTWPSNTYTARMPRRASRLCRLAACAADIFLRVGISRSLSEARTQAQRLPCLSQCITFWELRPRLEAICFIDKARSIKIPMRLVFGHTSSNLRHEQPSDICA